jgi:hypothetical protein
MEQGIEDKGAAASQLGSAVPQHTPGPWVTDGSMVYSDHGVQLHVADCTALTNRQKANAHLIAAAPDLLAALKDLRKHFLIAWGYEPPVGSIHRPITDKAGDAIAKAEGLSAQSSSVRKDAVTHPAESIKG